MEAIDRALEKAPGDRFQTADELQRALESTETGLRTAGLGLKTRWKWLSQRTRRTASLATAAVLIVLSAAVAKVIWWGDPLLDPLSMVVLPFRDATTTEAEEQLSVGLAAELTRQLNRWDSVSAVSEVAHAGVRFDLGIAESILERVDDGLAVAREMGLILVNLTVKMR